MTALDKKLNFWRIIKRLAAATAIFLALFGVGLQYFVHELRNDRSKIFSAAAEGGAPIGIVVATGGDGRIDKGVSLLRQNPSSRLLISGTGVGVEKDDIARLVIAHRGDQSQINALMRCCIDLGETAINTQGNAREAADWAEKHGFRAVILVTADYHMPRALIEFRRLMPRVEIIPYAVMRWEFVEGAPFWWSRPVIVTQLAREFGKYLISRVRI